MIDTFFGRPPSAVSLLSLTVVVFSGCGGEPPADSGGSDEAAPASEEAVPWRVSDQPRLQIGVVEGAEPYELSGVNGAIRLPDGGFVVANGGSDEIRFFDAEGNYLHAQGREGDGPGDWRGPDRIRHTGTDTLVVLDSRLRRIGRVTTAGEFVGSEPMPTDVLFPSDHWIYGRFVVDSPLLPEERWAVVPALDRMGADDGPVALVRVTPAGMLWVTTWAPATAAVDWRIHDLEGEHVAELTTPARFEVTDQGEDWVLGVRRDSLDVEYVQLLELDRAGVPYRPGALERAAGETTREAPVFQRVAGGTHPDINGALKQTASLQEIHYAQNYTYASHPDSLGGGDWLPEGTRFEILRAGSDGWAGRIVREESDQGCMLVYGRFSLIGIPSGALLCWGEPEDGEEGG